MELSDEYKAKLIKTIKDKKFNIEIELEYLAQKGFDKEIAKMLIHNEIVLQRNKAIENAKKAHEEGEERKAAFILALIVGIFGAVFQATSIVYYLIAMLIAGGIGYWGYKKTPIAGVIGCIAPIFIMPIAYNLYISGRTSILNIEMIIPLGLAAVPSYFIIVGLTSMIYPEKDGK